MNPERWQKIEDLFQSARTRTTSERAAFLDGACAADAELRAEVEALLQAEDSAGSFINTSAVKVAAGIIASDRVAEMQGRTITHYKIISAIGAGGMGEIYLAEDTELGRKVALKFLPDYALVDDERVRRFRQEARVASALSHPSIAHIYEIGEWNGAVFIALEYVAGQTLATRIATSPLDVQEIVDIAIQVADALDEAHRQGITHRDIKSANLMLTSRGQVKVLDFGLAKMTHAATVAAAPAGQAAQVETHPGVVMGTVSYMSPEQAMGHEVDTRTDIWSLGVVLYEMATGRLPFNGDSVTETIDRIAHAQPEAIARFNYDVPPELEVIVKKALRKKREERYQTAADLLSDLKNLKQELESGGRLDYAGAQRSASPAADTGEIGAAHPTTSAEYLIGEIKKHRRGVTLTLAILILTLGGAAVGLYWFSWRAAPATRPRAPLQTMKIVRLTASGNAGSVNISPDGKYVAYRLRTDDGLQSLWVRQVATGTTLQIVPLAAIAYEGTTFSRDSNLIYYVASGALYQVPVIGGAPKKLLTNISGPVTQSPDGSRLAFVRRDDRSADLTVANVDGTGAYVLATRRKPDWFDEQGPSWSPDGKTIACGGGSTTPIFMDTVFAVDVNSRAVSRLTAKNWATVKRVRWLGDGGRLVVLAVDSLMEFTQIWEVSFPSGEVNRITNDLNGHGTSDLGVTADDKTIAAVASSNVSRIWTVPVSGEADQPRQVTTGPERDDGRFGIAWTPDGRIVYASMAGGSWDLWITNADGSNQRQLADVNTDSFPIISPDGKYVVFKSQRSEDTSHLYRMEMDGGSPRQLTSSNDHAASFSPDGQWVFYSANDGKHSEALWKVSIDGGTPVRLTDYKSQWPDVSPDGRFIVCDFLDEGAGHPQWRIGILSADGGAPIKILDLPPQASHRVHWTRDGRTLLYVDTRNGVSNIWRLPLDGGKPVQITNFESELISKFDLSYDGKQFALARGTSAGDVILISDFR
jgi:serine/threonine protein kinase/Tol biopolymer transport system component